MTTKIEEPTKKGNKSYLQKLWVPIVLAIGFVAGEVLSYETAIPQFPGRRRPLLLHLPLPSVPFQPALRISRPPDDRGGGPARRAGGGLWQDVRGDKGKLCARPGRRPHRPSCAGPAVLSHPSGPHRSALPRGQATRARPWTYWPQTYSRYACTRCSSTSAWTELKVEDGFLFGRLPPVLRGLERPVQQEPDRPLRPRCDQPVRVLSRPEALRVDEEALVPRSLPSCLSYGPWGP